MQTTQNTKIIPAFEARRKFGKLLQGILKGDKYVVERNGEKVAAVVPIEVYEQCMTNEQIGQIIAEMRSFATIVKPKQKLNVVKDDPADDKFLECAQEAGAEYIISADPHLLNVEQYADIQILSPSEFLIDHLRLTSHLRG